MPKPEYYETNRQAKTLLIGVHAPYNRTADINSYYEEFANLVKTNGVTSENNLFVKIRIIDPAYFFPKGKLEEIKQICEKHGIEQIIISDAITPQQERNLEDYLECYVTDRTQLILEIFEKAAHSAEGKKQVTIALLQHRKTRLSGKGIFLEQQTGVKGGRGPGEKIKERDRRYIEQQIQKLKGELVTLQQVRETQRKQRLGRHIPQICLVGYTNAGKSTILNTLTKSDVLAEDKLFATLDTTTRSLYINNKQVGVLSDTVGFIQQLPPHLIEAFKSTLSELHYADLLLHVVDLSDTSWEEHLQIVATILDSLNVHKEILYVFNKQDRVSNLEQMLPTLERYQPQVIVSAHSKSGLQPLIDFLGTWKPSVPDANKAN
ncbi:MAG: GTPase HflX [bacterium]|nr:GTPase HflX [bacterium]